MKRHLISHSNTELVVREDSQKNIQNSRKAGLPWLCSREKEDSEHSDQRPSIEALTPIDRCPYASFYAGLVPRVPTIVVFNGP